jgi:hypothetical protein
MSYAYAHPLCVIESNTKKNEKMKRKEKFKTKKNKGQPNPLTSYAFMPSYTLIVPHEKFKIYCKE